MRPSRYSSGEDLYKDPYDVGPSGSGRDSDWNSSPSRYGAGGGDTERSAGSRRDARTYEPELPSASRYDTGSRERAMAPADITGGGDWNSRSSRTGRSISPRVDTDAVSVRGSKGMRSGGWFSGIAPLKSSEKRMLRPEDHSGGSVALEGRVVSYQVRKRRRDFFHVMYDTLINGAPLSFSPQMQVFTIELNDSDYTQIDASQRRSAVVNMVGSVYDGTIRIQDIVSVKGNWSTNHTVNASKVHNKSNGSTVVTSHTIPAGVVRCAALLLVVLLVILISNIASGNFMGGNSSGVLGGLVAIAIAVWLLISWAKSRRGRRFLRKLLLGAGAIVLVVLLLRIAPSMLESVLVIALMLYGISLMCKAVKRRR